MTSQLTKMMRRMIAGAALAALLGPTFGNTVSAQQVPAASVILRNFEATFAGVDDFTATLEADVNMERVRIPKMTATVYFKRPDKVRYVSPSFAMLPKEGIAMNPAALRERFDPELAGTDTVGGRIAYRLQLTAKDPKARLRQMLLWIDAQQWTAAKLETVPYGGRKLTVLFTYARSQEASWLPTQVIVQFSVADEADPLGQGLPPARDDQARSQPRTGTMTIRYSDYKINTGLSDEFLQSVEAPR